MAKIPKELIEKRKFGNEEFEVIFRKAIAPEESGGTFPPLSPGVTIENGIRIERDIAVPLRDGKIIYTDIYRPDGATNLPAIIAWSPYGKRAAYSPLPDSFEADDPAYFCHPDASVGVPPGTVSPMAKYEGPDPAYWCHYGYAVVNPDARGAGYSEGNINKCGTQEGKDGYDFIEWLASRDWSNGKIGMTGNSYLAISEWFIAAAQPPHLSCIAPWEGASDIYRELICCGGIPEVGFTEAFISHQWGLGYVEDFLTMARRHPLMNSYWEDKIACFENIKIPAYIAAGWCHRFHLRGTIEAFRRIASPRKWLRIHRDFEWPDARIPENLEDLRRFFDRYLKDIRNGWEMTPPVRLDVMDAGDTDYQIKRPEKEFPLARTQYQKLYLDAATGKLSPDPVTKESSARYEATKESKRFTIRFDEDTELTGYMKLRLWVEADGSDDMDLFVAVNKLDEKGNLIPVLVVGKHHPGSPGKLRVSHREQDEERSTPYQPVHTHRHEQLLKPKEIVPVEVEIWPSSMLWHKGQQLCVEISGHYIQEPGWFESFDWETRNRGDHVIHTGGKYDSHLLVPVIPPKYTAGTYVFR